MATWPQWMNFLSPGICGSNFKRVHFNFNFEIDILGIWVNIALAASCYLNQWFPSSVMHIQGTKGRWIENCVKKWLRHLHLASFVSGLHVWIWPRLPPCGMPSTDPTPGCSHHGEKFNHRITGITPRIITQHEMQIVAFTSTELAFTRLIPWSESISSCWKCRTSFGKTKFEWLQIMGKHSMCIEQEIWRCYEQDCARRFRHNKI